MEVMDSLNDVIDDRNISTPPPLNFATHPCRGRNASPLKLSSARGSNFSVDLSALHKSDDHVVSDADSVEFGLDQTTGNFQSLNLSSQQDGLPSHVLSSARYRVGHDLTIEPKVAAALRKHLGYRESDSSITTHGSLDRDLSVPLDSSGNFLSVNSATFTCGKGELTPPTTPNHRSSCRNGSLSAPQVSTAVQSKVTLPTTIPDTLAVGKETPGSAIAKHHGIVHPVRNTHLGQTQQSSMAVQSAPAPTARSGPTTPSTWISASPSRNAKGKFYVVTVGRHIGVFDSWYSTAMF